MSAELRFYGRWDYGRRTILSLEDALERELIPGNYESGELEDIKDQVLYNRDFIVKLTALLYANGKLSKQDILKLLPAHILIE